MGKIEKHQIKKYLVVDNYILNKVGYKIKEIIGIKKFDATKILIGTNNAVNDFKNAVILIMWVIKDNDKSFPQLSSEEGLVSQNWWEINKTFLRSY